MLPTHSKKEPHALVLCALPFWFFFYTSRPCCWLAAAGCWSIYYIRVLRFRSNESQRNRVRWCVPQLPHTYIYPIRSPPWDVCGYMLLLENEIYGPLYRSSCAAALLWVSRCIYILELYRQKNSALIALSFVFDSFCVSNPFDGTSRRK
jgi:hypothetical protein